MFIVFILLAMRGRSCSVLSIFVNKEIQCHYYLCTKYYIFFVVKSLLVCICMVLHNTTMYTLYSLHLWKFVIHRFSDMDSVVCLYTSVKVSCYPHAAVRVSCYPHAVFGVSLLTMSLSSLWCMTSCFLIALAVDVASTVDFVNSAGSHQPHGLRTFPPWPRQHQHKEAQWHQIFTKLEFMLHFISDDIKMFVCWL